MTTNSDTPIRGVHRDDLSALAWALTDFWPGDCGLEALLDRLEARGRKP